MHPSARQRGVCLRGEDVLEVYQRQYADNEVLVCLDETSKQQVKETRQPRPAQPGAVGRRHEYERNGVVFMLRTAGVVAPGGSEDRRSIGRQATGGDEAAPGLRAPVCGGW